MNWGALKLRASQELGLSRSAADSPEDDQVIGDLANEAVIDILMKTRIYTRTVTLTLTANEDEYDINASVLQLHNVSYIKSDGTRGDELQEVSPGDLREAGKGSYAMMGFNRIALGWIPTGTGTDLQLLAWYTPSPTPMTSAAHDPAVSPYGIIPVQFHPAIVDYMCWKAGQYADHVVSQYGESFRAKYEGRDGDTPLGSHLGDIKAYINKRVGSGSAQGRRRRMGERTISDVDSSYYVG